MSTVTLKKYYKIHSQLTKGKEFPERRGDKHPQWKGGKSFEPYPLGWTRLFKEQIRQRDNYTCQLCGVPEVECCKRLHVHHIDYVKENIKPKNLISLCASCHSKTHHRRDYWLVVLRGITTG